MAKNLIPDVCKLLGVEVGEIFTIKGYEHYEYRISEAYGMAHRDRNKTNQEWKMSELLFDALLFGRASIIKFPWKPKENEIVWTFFIVRNTLRVAQMKFIKSQIECLALWKAGWIYRTREEAETALPKVTEELGGGRI